MHKYSRGLGSRQGVYMGIYSRGQGSRKCVYSLGLGTRQGVYMCEYRMVWKILCEGARLDYGYVTGVCLPLRVFVI